MAFSENNKFEFGLADRSPIEREREREREQTPT